MKSRSVRTAATATRFRRKPLITALEPRLLLDGAAVATAVELATDVDFQEQSTDGTTDTTVHSASAEDAVHFTEVPRRSQRKPPAAKSPSSIPRSRTTRHWSLAWPTESRSS